MLLILGLLLFIVLASLLLLLPTLWGRTIYHEYSGSRLVTCPENQRQVAVSLDAVHAAATALKGPPDFRLSDCSRWPERARCAQECLPQAIAAEPYQTGEGKVAEKRIYHLPVLLATFAAWYLGAVWHSHYLFRTQWMEAVGLTPGQLRQMLFWYSPHLLSVAICLLFAYGVGWVVALRGRKGIGQGILTALILWGAVTLASWYGIASLSRNLVVLEATYTALAAVLVGAIIGGLGDRLRISTAVKPAG